MSELICPIQLRGDSALNWTASNPTLMAGEAGVETDTGRFKIGNGTAAWSGLPYAGGVQSVSNSDGTLTITTTSGTVTASLALANANTWTGVQTFGNNISFGGKQLSVSGLSPGQTLQYNGTNWVNATISSGNASVELNSTSGAAANCVPTVTGGCNQSTCEFATTASAGTLTIANPAVSGNVNDGQILILRLYTLNAQAVSYGTAYAATSPSVPLLMATYGGVYDYLIFRYNGATSLWDPLGWT